MAEINLRSLYSMTMGGDARFKAEIQAFQLYVFGKSGRRFSRSSLLYHIVRDSLPALVRMAERGQPFWQEWTVRAPRPKGLRKSKYGNQHGTPKELAEYQKQRKIGTFQRVLRLQNKFWDDVKRKGHL